MTDMIASEIRTGQTVTVLGIGNRRRVTIEVGHIEELRILPATPADRIRVIGTQETSTGTRAVVRILHRTDRVNLVADVAAPVHYEVTAGPDGMSARTVPAASPRPQVTARIPVADLVAVADRRAGLPVILITRDELPPVPQAAERDWMDRLMAQTDEEAAAEGWTVADVVPTGHTCPGCGGPITIVRHGRGDYTDCGGPMEAGCQAARDLRPDTVDAHLDALNAHLGHSAY